MRKPHLGLWNDLNVKFDMAGSSMAKERQGKKRRHQRQPRLCPIQLEPLEQRRLLSASVTQDLFAVPAGTTFNTTNLPWWTTINPTGETPMITDDQLQITTITEAENYPQTIYLATGSTGVNGTANTVSSVQQATFSTAGQTSQFGLVARANSAAYAYYIAETGKDFGNSGNGSLKILTVVGNTQTTLASVSLSTLGALNLNTEYNFKFLVQTDASNSLETDLKADIWQQGTTDPGWQLSTTDTTSRFNGTGASSSGYDGIFSNPVASGGNTCTISNYLESNTPGDLPEINSFTTNPTAYSSTYPATFDFNAAATSPALTFSPTGTAESITQYQINFGDGSPVLTVSSSSMSTVFHAYTSAPADAYTATLTVTDSNGGTAAQSIEVDANTGVSTDPTGHLIINRDGGNGINTDNPLLVNFISNGTPYTGTGYSITSYTLNYGDGDVVTLPLAGGYTTSSTAYNIVHQYLNHGTYYPTLTLTGNDGATTVIDAPSIVITNKAQAPTVATSFNSTTNILTAIFSEDVGAALVGQVDSNDAALGEPLWTDGASTVNTTGNSNVSYMIPGSFATDLDIRNDNSGANVSLTSTQLDSIFSYSNTAPFTATWNLSGYVNTTSTSYTARIFASTALNDPGTGIQDQAGNDLDGINSGIGGQDATLHFGSSYTTLTLTLATNGVWNSSMPLVFAPSIQPITPGGGSILSIATTSVGGTASTVINFTVNATNQAILSTLAITDVEGAVVIEDMPTGYTTLDGIYTTTSDVSFTGSSASLTIPASSSGLHDSMFPSGSGNMHISPEGGGAVDNSWPYVYEKELMIALEDITGATSIPFTGTDPSSGIFVGDTSEFDGGAGDLVGYDKKFDDEAQLGFTGYLVNSNGSDLYLLGGPNGNGSGENAAIDAFLQSLGMEEYGPIDTKYGGLNGSSNPLSDAWQITPSLTNLSGSWDIRQVPSISYLNDTDVDGGAPGFSTLYMFTYGGGDPTPAAGAGEGSLTTQSNMGFGTPTSTDLYNHPDWWTSVGSLALQNGGEHDLDSGYVNAATFMPLGTVTPGDTFSISLKSGGSFETVTYTATSSDTVMSSLVNDIVAYIDTSTIQTADPFFSTASSNLTIQTNSDYNTNGPLSLSSTKNPVVEFYESTGSAPYYLVGSSATSSSGATFIPDVYQDNKLDFANPGVYTHAINSWVVPWASTAAPGSLISLSANDGVGYDQSVATEDTMHSNNPWQITDDVDYDGDWWGYNQNGVLVSGDSESYWTLLDEVAQYVLQNYPGKGLLIGGLEYVGTSQPPSIAMEPNVYIEPAENSDVSADSKDQQLKIDSNAGALVGIYKDWDIYGNNGDATSVPSDLVPSTLKKDMTTYNNDHVFALEGENAPSFAMQMPGYLMAGVLSNNASAANAVTMQNVLTNYYNSSYGPAAPYMEDYEVMFNGTAADPNLWGLPAVVSFNGNSFTNSKPKNDLGVVQESYGYLDAADNALHNAYTNGSITSTQYNADQARVDQNRMYNVFLFSEYQLESDYYTLNIGGVNSLPISSQAFTTIMNDLTNVVSWVDDLYSTNLVNVANFDPFFQPDFSKLQYFWANDPNGSNGLTTNNAGLLNVPSSSNTPSQTTLNMDWSADETFMNMTPAVPTSLTATATAATTVKLTWTDNDAGAATEYVIDRSTSATNFASSSITTFTTGSGATTYSDTTVSAATSYYYEVDSVDANGASDFSNVASPMAVPESVAATAVSSSQINLSWIDYDGGAATGYDIDRSTTSSGGFSQIATVGSGATAYSSTGLTDGTTYYYEVAAFNGTTTSGFSSLASAVTTMNAPSSLSATAASSSQINLTWTDHDSSVATAYDIDRSTTSTGGFILVGTVGAGATSYSDTGLLASTTYYYEVDAVGTATTSFFSNIASATTSSGLGTPTGVTGTEVNGSNRAQSVDLTWTDNSDSSATAYDIDRSTTSTGGFTQVGTVAGATASAYTDATVFPSTTYYYEVEAVNATTHSAFSSVSNAAIMPTNEVGSVATDNWYGANGSAWSTQWTQTSSNLTDTTAALTFNATNEGKAKFTSNGGSMSGYYLAFNNTNTYVDSYQSVLVDSDIASSSLLLETRSSSTSISVNYDAQLTFGASATLSIFQKDSGANTLISSFSMGTVSTGAFYDLEFEVVTANATTTDLYAKAWNITSATEPTAWQISTHDATAGLQGVSGYDGMRFDLEAGTAENTFLLDNYESVNLVSSNASYLDNFQNSSTTGWSPLTASRWTVGTKGNATNGYSVRYYINTSSYTGGSGGSLGEYSLLNATGYTNVGDFTMTVDAAAGSSTAGSNYAIVFGYQNSTNYYFMEFNATSGDTALYKVVSGTASVVATATGGQITDTLYHAIKIQRKGTSISVWYDGNSILTTTDATFIGGEIGLGALNDAAYFDNVIVG